jgi:hypothetical protein
MRYWTESFALENCLRTHLLSSQSTDRQRETTICGNPKEKCDGLDKLEPNGEITVSQFRLKSRSCTSNSHFQTPGPEICISSQSTNNMKQRSVVTLKNVVMNFTFNCAMERKLGRH